MTQELLCLRDQIDSVDKRLLELFALRFQFVRMVATYKAEQGIPARIPGRIKAVIEDREETAVSLGLPQRAALNIWTAIVEESCRYEEGLLTTAKPSNESKANTKQRSQP